jgi:hypothetical protein
MPGGDRWYRASWVRGEGGRPRLQGSDSAHQPEPAPPAAPGPFPLAQRPVAGRARCRCCIVALNPIFPPDASITSGARNRNPAHCRHSRRGFGRACCRCAAVPYKSEPCAVRGASFRAPGYPPRPRRPVHSRPTAADPALGLDCARTLPRRPTVLHDPSGVARSNAARGQIRLSPALSSPART